HSIFIPNGEMVGKRAASIWVYIEFIAARLPTLQILGEKKSSKYLKFNTPALAPFFNIFTPICVAISSPVTTMPRWWA
ncbi:MAG: hypothetical protein DRR00_34190, partial [Candidatus Parabeggiatoa sp. nov. 3]